MRIAVTVSIALLCCSAILVRSAEAQPVFYPNPDFTLTSINIHNWPTQDLFTFSVGGASFSQPWINGTYDITPPPALVAKMQDGQDEIVRMQVGSNFIDRPSSFYLLPATGREQTIDGVTRWQSNLFPPSGIGWEGFRLGRIFLSFATSNGDNRTYLEVHGGAPEPASLTLAIVAVVGLALFNHRREG